mgnify:CR=1 FL=1
MKPEDALAAARAEVERIKAAGGYLEPAGAVTIDKNDPSRNTIWLGTGEANTCGSGCGAGVVTRRARRAIGCGPRCGSTPDASITLRVYAHWIPDGSTMKAVDLLDDAQPSATQTQPEPAPVEMAEAQ